MAQSWPRGSQTAYKNVRKKIKNNKLKIKMQTAAISIKQFYGIRLSCVLKVERFFLRK